MPTPQQLRDRLMKKLKELFQLDQPDLDFGFYRIMHARAKEIQTFIEEDLLATVAGAFGGVDEEKKAALYTAYEKAVKTACEYGAPDPESTPAVKEAKALYEAVESTVDGEAEVYDHLYRFFERYYDDGDFVSRRYYARETEGKAAPFVIPYNGEEVKLHWANADQYYVKTAEYFTHFTFDVSQAAEVRALNDFERTMLKLPEGERNVHFRIVAAAEGEHGNVKASDATKRFFILHGECPVALTDDNELVVNFEYRPDPEKSKQDGAWRNSRNKEAVDNVLAALETRGASEPLYQKYFDLLQVAAPTEKEKKRPLLAKYINQYTARNSMDYFIHKDLGGFLRRELDFYIKNEVMRLDDIENADAPAVETYLSKIRVLRKIGGKLIDFLAQLEEFQKKLWLKKKFVVETNYCVTLDRVPENLYPEICQNEAQVDEWIQLFAIDEIKETEGELLTPGTPGFSRPLTPEFLKAHDKLVLDTRFFDDSFQASLVASIEDFDAQCDGVLLHSENFQALNLLQARYREQVKCVYIDPPYNTGKDGFSYKDGYLHSSWFSLLSDREDICKSLMVSDGSTWVSLDDFEGHYLKCLFDSIKGRESFLMDFIWKKRDGAPNDRTIGSIHEHIFCWGTSNKTEAAFNLMPRTEKADSQYQVFSEPDGPDPRGPFRKIDTTANGKGGRFVESLCYPIVNPYTKEEVLPRSGTCWRHNYDDMKKLQDDKRLFWGVKGTAKTPMRKLFKTEAKQGMTTPSIWGDVGYNQHASNEIERIFGEKAFFDTPKPSSLVQRILHIGTVRESIILDYFAGSGTTGHAVINLNRQDGGHRKYILIEMGDHFDTVLKPRIAKVVYSEGWKDGKPTARDTGVFHCVKYLRLESYEDTLNNLRVDENPASRRAVSGNASLKEDYMLRYMLDVESRGSQSLLNIDAFKDPTAYTLNVKKPGTDVYVTRPVDLMETFNLILGLRVTHMALPQAFYADFHRLPDPELPEDQHTRLLVNGKIRQNDAGPWWFRKVEGWVPKAPADSGNGQQEKVLIVWRKLTDDLEKDNLVLDEWFQTNRFSALDSEYDTIYVNGSNNLPNLRQKGETWKVRLIEEAFMKGMWEVQG